jgi:hypothetical protein
MQGIFKVLVKLDNKKDNLHKFQKDYNKQIQRNKNKFKI